MTGQLHLDLTIHVKPDMTVRDSHAVELRVRNLIKERMRQVMEVQIHVHGEEVTGETGTDGRCQ